MDEKIGAEKNPILPLQQPILLGCLGFGFLWFALPIYSKILGASALEIGGMFSIFALTIALLRPLIGIASDKMGRKYFFVAAFFRSYFGSLSDRFGRIRLMALGVFGSGIFSFLLPGLPGIVWLTIFWTFESVGWAMAGPAEEAMVADLTGHQVRGLGYGFYTFVSSMGASIGPLAGGWLYDSLGRAVPFYLNGVVLLMGALLILLLLGKKRLSS
jgi:MFS family permease